MAGPGRTTRLHEKTLENAMVWKKKKTQRTTACPHRGRSPKKHPATPQFIGPGRPGPRTTGKTHANTMGLNKKKKIDQKGPETHRELLQQPAPCRLLARSAPGHEQHEKPSKTRWLSRKQKKKGNKNADKTRDELKVFTCVPPGRPVQKRCPWLSGASRP